MRPAGRLTWKRSTDELKVVQAGPEGATDGKPDMFDGQEEARLKSLWQLAGASRSGRNAGAQGLAAAAAGLYGKGHNVAHERPRLYHGAPPEADGGCQRCSSAHADSR